MAKKDDPKGIVLPVGRTHRIVGAPLGYTLERRVGPLGTEKWRSPSYYSTLHAAVEAAFEERVRTSNANGAEEIAQRIEEIREEFRRDLAPLMTPPSVE